LKHQLDFERHDVSRFFTEYGDMEMAAPSQHLTKEVTSAVWDGLSQLQKG